MECKQICGSSTPSSFRVSDPQSLLSHGTSAVLANLKLRAPVLHSLLAMAAGVVHGDETGKEAASVVTAASVLLHQRNKQTAALPHAVGLMLDFRGATDKTISAMANLGISVATSTILAKKAAIAAHHDKVLKDTIIKRKDTVTVAGQSVGNIQGWEIYGDNLDHSVHTYYMTKESRGNDIHWFLLVGAPMRVVPPPGIDKTRPRRNILAVANHEFVPSVEDNLSLGESFKFHVMEVLTKYLPFLKEFAPALPKYLDHPHVNEMKKKSPFCILDLLDKSENSGEEMIDILQTVHSFIPRVDATSPNNIIERMVFAGDVLTNKRAYQAQIDMINAVSESESLKGVIHRPEGLHLCMNLCKYIMEVFYSQSSVGEPGTLYQLKVMLDRRDIKLDMTHGYSQCRNYINDILDGHIVSAAMNFFGMTDISDQPNVSKPSPSLQVAERGLLLPMTLT